MKIRHGYSKSTGGEHRVSKGPGARQAHKDECDVNIIVDANQPLRGGPEFTEEIQDWNHPMSYHEMLNHIRETDEVFNQLPARIRAAHDNDPQKLLDFYQSDDFRSGKVDLFGDVYEPEEPAEAPPPAPPAEAQSTT